MLKYAILDYTPKRYLKRASFETLENNRLILDFKRGRKYAVKIVARLVAKTLSLVDLSDITIVCVPASSECLNKRRYKNFSNMLCRFCGAINAFDNIRVVGKRERIHLRTCELTNNVDIDDIYFAGRKVLVFDDIYTTGKSSRAFIERLQNAGAKVVMALFLAKTKSY